MRGSPGVLRLADGTVIRDTTRSPQGMRHRVVFGVEEAVAGIQFAHLRLELAGRPGVPPWRDVVALLGRAVSSSDGSSH